MRLLPARYFGRATGRHRPKRCPSGVVDTAFRHCPTCGVDTAAIVHRDGTHTCTEGHTSRAGAVQ